MLKQAVISRTFQNTLKLHSASKNFYPPSCFVFSMLINMLYILHTYFFIACYSPHNVSFMKAGSLFAILPSNT